MKLPIPNVFHSSVSSSYLCSNIPLSTLFSNTRSRVLPTIREAKFHSHKHNWHSYTFIYFNLIFFDNGLEDYSDVTK
jgi:hypothetical protein